MTFTFLSYEVTDTGVQFEFGDDNDKGFYLFIPDAELAGVSTPAQLRSLLESKLRRKVNREGVASKLDPFIGQTIII